MAKKTIAKKLVKKEEPSSSSEDTDSSDDESDKKKTPVKPRNVSAKKKTLWSLTFPLSIMFDCASRVKVWDFH